VIKIVQVICDWCEELYDMSVCFYAYIIDTVNPVEEGVACADCISAWFSQDPYSIKSVNIMNLSLIEYKEGVLE